MLITADPIKSKSRITLDVAHRNLRQSSSKNSEHASVDTFNQFLSLFPHRTDSVVRSSELSGWREVSRFHQLADSDILLAMQKESNVQRGIRFDKESRIFALQIPPGSRYRGAESVDSIVQILSKCGAKPKLYQYGHDCYIFVFLSKWAAAKPLVETLSHILAFEGFSLSNEDLSVCPKAPIPVPLQKGFSWLNSRGLALVARDEISLQSAMEFFLSDVTRCAVEPTVFLQSMQSMLHAQLMGSKELKAVDAVQSNQPSEKADSFSIDFRESSLASLGQPLADFLAKTGLTPSSSDGFSCYTIGEQGKRDVEKFAKLAECRQPANDGFISSNRNVSRSSGASGKSSRRLRGTIDNTGHIFLTEIPDEKVNSF